MTSATLPQPVNDDFWRHVGGGHASSCGIKRDGTLWCWGDNSFGQLGTGSTTPEPVPAQVGTDTDWEQVSVAWYHACASKLDGELWCWGQVPGLAASMTPALVPLVP
jgi:alpha-tubulin suppressor-like RCC1 family protein